MKILVMILLVVLPFGSNAQTVFSANDRAETPNRNYDVQHYRIEVTLHEDTKSVDGNVTITLVPLFPRLEILNVQAGNMQIKRVTLGKNRDLQYHSSANNVSITLDKPYSYKDTLAVSIEYSCKPKNGLTFNGPDSAFPQKRPQIWSQGEDTTNHYWFPCYDYPNDKSTSEVIATVNSKFTLLSNGKLLSVKEDKKNKTKTFHWKESKPHSSYLIMIAAGEYTVLRETVGRLPLEYYVYPDDTTNAGMTFRQTPSMIRFFNEATGFTYPWEKYAQIILQDHFGGMENTSATTLSDVWAVPDLRARPDVQPSSLLAHELAHQWWGDVVTCKDFRHIWLNESFASYYDPLYHERTLGRDEFDYTMYQDQQAGVVVDTTRGRKPIVSVESYGDNVYPRGAAVLHMLRFLLGDDMYHRAIKHYITKHQFQAVETNDLKVAIEEATGQNLKWFFDEWIYKAGHPVFDLSYTWDVEKKAVLLSVKQTQTMDSLTGVFRMPVDIEITTPSGITTQRVGILTKDTTYVLPCTDKPLLVIFDKGNWLLKELNWEKSREEWRYQATSASNPVDRIRAVQTLAKLPPGIGTAAVLSDRILFDSFWAVRREAALRAGTVAGKSDTVKPVLKPALLSALKDVRSQVRNAAAGALGAFRGGDVVGALKTSLEDSSYGVIGSALRSLAQADSAHALPVVKQYLTYRSHQNSVMNAALNVLGTLDTTEAVNAALNHVKYGNLVGTRFTSLGILRRLGKSKPEVIEALQSVLADKSDALRATAAQILGDLGDASVIPALEAIANDKDNPASNAAKTSVEKIRKRLEQKK
ncbi:MAG: M1 family aminopeptidase [Bacteroidota bacterium]